MKLREIPETSGLIQVEGTSRSTDFSHNLAFNFPHAESGSCIRDPVDHVLGMVLIASRILANIIVRRQRSCGICGISSMSALIARSSWYDGLPIQTQLEGRRKEDQPTAVRRQQCRVV